MNFKKRGRPFIFPDSFVRFVALLYILFLPYRQLEGFFGKLSEYIPKLKPADYTTLFKRIKKMDLKLPEINDVVVVLDSTGMKVTTGGEWIRDKWKVRKGWIKVHITVDAKKKRLLSLKITDEGVGDGRMLKPLIDDIEKRGGKIERLYADTGYDSRDNFNYLESIRYRTCNKGQKEFFY